MMSLLQELSYLSLLPPIYLLTIYVSTYVVLERTSQAVSLNAVETVDVNFRYCSLECIQRNIYIKRESRSHMSNEGFKYLQKNMFQRKVYSYDILITKG